jgi:hypothetical protein
MGEWSGWGLKCSDPACNEEAFMRVRLYDVDSIYWGCEEKDLCRAHLDVVAGAYPDNIETVTEYAREEGS